MPKRFQNRDPARREALISNGPGAIYRCAPGGDWSIEFFGDEVEALCGHPASDFIQNRVRSFVSVIHPDDRLDVERQVVAALARREPFELEFRIVHADGSVRWAFERGRGAEDEHGQVASWTAPSSTSPRGRPPSRASPTWPITTS